MTELQHCTQGHIDNIDAGRINGWFFDSQTPDRPEFYLTFDDQSVITSSSPDIFRQDLAAAGLGNGICAFSVKLDLLSADLEGRTVQLRDQAQNLVSQLEIEQRGVNFSSLRFKALENHRLIFNVNLDASVLFTAVVYCNGVQLLKSEFQLTNGSNEFSVRLPTSFVRPAVGLYQLAVEGCPGFVWQSELEDSEKASWTIAGGGYRPDLKLNGLKLLSSCLAVKNSSGFDASPYTAAFSLLNGTLSASLKLAKVAQPDISVILPLRSSGEAARRMVASIVLGSETNNFEVVWPTDHHQQSALPAVGVIKSDLCGTAIASLQEAVSRARGRFVLFCPYTVELSPNVIPSLISELENKEVAFASAKVIDESGLTHCVGHGAGGTNGQLCARHLSLSFRHPVAHCLHGLTAYRKSDLLKVFCAIDQAPTTDSVSEVLFTLQSLLLTDQATGVFLGHEEVYSVDALKDEPQPNRAQNVVQNPSRRGTVFVLDAHTPTPDKDAGSYAAVQEMRLIKALGYQVVFVPLDLKHVPQYTKQLQREGIEVCYQPHYGCVADLIQERQATVSAFYITRYTVAASVIDFIRQIAPDKPVLFNNADLHFLRELREALSMPENDGQYSIALANAQKTRDKELEVMQKCDVLLSYNDAEHAVITSHILRQDNVFKCPWVLERKPEPPCFSAREGIAFLGGFKHAPNIDAVEYFITDIMPQIQQLQPDIKLYVYGSHMPEALKELQSDSIELVGFIENLDDLFLKHRVFIAPLRSGAGIKGKVLESVAYGLPCVLSPIAAESTGVTHNISALIAETTDEWVSNTLKLYNNEDVWSRVSQNQLYLAEELYSFDAGLMRFSKAFHFAGLSTTLS